MVRKSHATMLAKGTIMKLTDRDYEVLGELEFATRNHTEVGFRDGWAKPMDCGGTNGSHHGATLVKLAKAGLADKQGYTPGRRAVWMYKINDAGKAAWAQYRASKRASGGKRN
jgi:hypothetical protein